jgi:hypothetical protein
MATTRDREKRQESESQTPSRAPQVIYICVSIVLLLVAAAYLVLSRWTNYQLPNGLPRGNEYQVLYALISAEVVLALYLWGVGPWSDVAAPSGVKKPPPAGQVPPEQRARASAAGERKEAAGVPPTAHPPLGPPLTPKAKSKPSAEGSC